MEKGRKMSQNSRVWKSWRIPGRSGVRFMAEEMLGPGGCWRFGGEKEGMD